MHSWWPRVISLQTTHKAWWRHQMETFSALLALCAGNSPVPVNSPHKGQWLGALMFSFIYAWINDWVNNREAGDLRRQDGHYDLIVMGCPHKSQMSNVESFVVVMGNAVPYDIGRQYIKESLTFLYGSSNTPIAQMKSYNKTWRP